MNRKTKFPCGEHYQKMRDSLGLENVDVRTNDPKNRWTTKEENLKAYDPYCQECRISYKYPDNHPIFKSKYVIMFHFLKLSDFKEFIKYLKAVIKSYGILTTIRKLFYDHYKVWDYQYNITFPFVDIVYYYLTLDDLRQRYEDLSKFKDVLKGWKFNEEDTKIIKHFQKVAYRYNRMWEKQLKEKK